VKKFCWSAWVVRREQFPMPRGMVPVKENILAQLQKNSEKIDIKIK
jgi:hypothetical protein